MVGKAGAWFMRVGVEELIAKGKGHNEAHFKAKFAAVVVKRS